MMPCVLRRVAERAGKGIHGVGGGDVNRGSKQDVGLQLEFE